MRRVPTRFIPAAGAILALISLAAAAAFTQTRPAPEQILKHSRLEVDLPDFPAEGLILDIGGGGEGVISQLKGGQVVAVDLIKRELEEAPGEPLLKIVMDARELKFLDKTFPTATAFFTFMYIDPADHGKVFDEIRRVLAAGGRFLIWDAFFPKRTDPRQIYVNFPLTVTLPKTKIVTGYGVRIVEDQGLSHFVELAKAHGFTVASSKTNEGWFALELVKN